MINFKQFLENSIDPVSQDVDSKPSAHLGHKATKKNDDRSVGLQKKNLDRLTGEYHKMSKDEGGSGTAKAHGDMFHNTKKNIHHEEYVNEDGGGGGAGGAAGAGAGTAPTATVAGIAGSGDSRLPSSQREPGVPKKKYQNSPVMSFIRRKNPKA
jgi:hypothetical protein